MILEGKTALVTGGGTGIGAAIVKKFVAEGAKVCIAGRRKEKLTETAAAVPEGTVTLCPGDVTNHEDVKKMVAAAVAFSGKLEILVNDAGAESIAGVVDLDPADWRAMLETNLTGPFMLMKESIPHMIEAGGGSVVNIASLAGLRCLPGFAAYCTSKAGLIMLTKQAALDYGPQNVRCNAVCPGCTVTDMTKRIVTPLAEALETDLAGAYKYFTQYAPLQRPADPSEIASVCAFLASDQSSYLTGEELLVDGGAAILDPTAITLKILG